MPRSMFIVTVGLLIAMAVGPTRADDAKRLALARQLMAQVHADDAIRSSIPLLLDGMRERLVQQGQSSQDAEAYVARYETRFAAEIGRYSDVMAAAYAQALTEDDLSALIAFNETAVGRKFTAARPALTQASVLVMRELEADVAKEVLGDIERERAQGGSPRKT